MKLPEFSRVPERYSVRSRPAHEMPDARNAKGLGGDCSAAAFVHDHPHQSAKPKAEIEVAMQSQTVLPIVSPADRRRSQRLLKFVPLVVRGASAGKKTFWEDTFTVDISAHGALLILAAKVGVGQKLVLMNTQN